MKKHIRSSYKKIQRNAVKMGWSLQATKKGTFYFPPNGGTPYLAHEGEKAIHVLRRFFKRHGVDIM